MVATWKTQVAPTFDAALKAAQKANESAIAGIGKVGVAGGDMLDTVGDSINRRDKMALMNLDTDQQREDYLTNNASSFHDPKEMETLRKELLATDKSRRTQGDRTRLIEQAAAIESAPESEQRGLMNEAAKFNAINGIKDTDGILGFHADHLLRNTEIGLKDSTLTEAGVTLGDERTYTPDTHKKVLKTMEDNIRRDNRGSSESAITKMATDALDRTKHGAMFSRMGKVTTALSTVDVEIEKHAGNLTSLIQSGDQLGLEKELERVSVYLRGKPKITAEQAKFIQAPMLKALDNVGNVVNGKFVPLDAYEEWVKMGPIDKATGQQFAPKATISNQKAFRRHLSEKFKDKFKFLDQKIFDIKIDDMVAKASGGLAADFQTGKYLAELKTQSARQYGEQSLEFQGELTNDLLSMRKHGILPHITKKLSKSFEKFTLGDGEEFTARDRNKLTGQADKVISKIYGLFKNNDKTSPDYGKTTLTVPQKQTLDLTLQRFLVGTAGIDPETGSWIPFEWDKKDMVLSTIDQYGDMSGASANMLMEEMMKFLPDMQDRHSGARERGAETFDTVLTKRLDQWNANPKNQKRKKGDGSAIGDVVEFFTGGSFTISRTKKGDNVFQNKFGFNQGKNNKK